ncbi:MAG: AMP-binding protein, partial [Candidatus Baltobacteraceae bacterium]
MSLSLASILAEAALRYPAKTALVAGPEQVSYGRLWEQTRRYAAALRGFGMGRGDRVALMIPNVPNFPRAYFAVAALGAVVVPIHALLTSEEIAYVLRDSGAKMLACAGSLLEEGAKGGELAGIPVLTLSGAPDSNLPALDELAAALDPIENHEPREPDENAVILYTSGTTGKPKGAILTQLNLVMNASVSAYDVLGLLHGDVILGSLPLFHAFGQTCAMNAGFRVGATLVLLPRFDPQHALETVVDERVNVFMGVPTMYVGLLEAAKKDARRPKLRLAVSGGASLPMTVLEQFEEIFGSPIY